MSSSSAFRPSPVSLFRGMAVAVLAVSLLAGTGCSKFRKKDDSNEGVPVETLYQKGHKSMTNGNWSSAQETYKRLIAQYPYGPYTEQALIETAYAQYKAGQHDDAVSTIDRFIRTYPTNRNIASRPSSVLRSSTMQRLPRPTSFHMYESPPSGGNQLMRRVPSPAGGSTLTTSAPKSAR